MIRGNVAAIAVGVLGAAVSVLAVVGLTVIA